MHAPLCEIKKMCIALKYKAQTSRQSPHLIRFFFVTNLVLIYSKQNHISKSTRKEVYVTQKPK